MLLLRLKFLPKALLLLHELALEELLLSYFGLFNIGLGLLGIFFLDGGKLLLEVIFHLQLSLFLLCELLLEVIVVLGGVSTGGGQLLIVFGLKCLSLLVVLLSELALKLVGQLFLELSLLFRELMLVFGLQVSSDSLLKLSLGLQILLLLLLGMQLGFVLSVLKLQVLNFLIVLSFLLLKEILSLLD